MWGDAPKSPGVAEFAFPVLTSSFQTFVLPAQEKAEQQCPSDTKAEQKRSLPLLLTQDQETRPTDPTQGYWSPSLFQKGLAFLTTQLICNLFCVLTYLHIICKLFSNRLSLKK